MAENTHQSRGITHNADNHLFPEGPSILLSHRSAIGAPAIRNFPGIKRNHTTMAVYDLGLSIIAEKKLSGILAMSGSKSVELLVYIIGVTQADCLEHEYYPLKQMKFEG
tara:strand:+ start:133 stop:459 length:327 start_codon:yes stop_codon:yes gene_type:complete